MEILVHKLGNFFGREFCFYKLYSISSKFKNYEPKMQSFGNKMQQICLFYKNLKHFIWKSFSDRAARYADFSQHVQTFWRKKNEKSVSPDLKKNFCFIFIDDFLIFV
jgi:hypothetical protein